MDEMADFDGGQLLAEVENTYPKLGILLRKYQQALNTLGQNAAAAPIGELSAPSKPAAVNVKVAGEIAHVTVNDPEPLQRGAQYHVEVANNPQFSQPHVEHLGSSRGRFLTLPTNGDDGAQHTWYVRAYSQYQGSQPSAYTNYGGDQPAGFTMSGGTNMTPLPSTGSGTASNDGQQGGSGLGKVIFRPAPAPKRSVNGS
jgi:hypothetical protein